MRTAKEGLKLAICAWCDANALDVANGEIVDLVRRLQSLDAMTACDADGMERITTDWLHFAADRIDGDSEKAERLRSLAAHISQELVAVGLTVDARCFTPDGERREPVPPDGLVEQVETDDDGPGTAVGEDDATPMRYDAIFIKPVTVMLNGERTKAIWPASYGRVRLQPEDSRRSVVVALDDLDVQSRALLRHLPTRRRTEVVVRCSVRNCRRCYRSWVRHDTRIEDLKGEPINEFSVLHAALCEEHRRTA